MPSSRTKVDWGDKSQGRSKVGEARRVGSPFGRRLRRALVAFSVIVAALGGFLIYSKVKTAVHQAGLEPFYSTTGLSAAGPLGQVMRTEPVGVSVKNGTGLRILYRTQRQDGTITFSSGMLFIPNNHAAGTPRPIVAWAHGTVGMGQACTPSRTPDPVKDISWVSEMLKRGWVVTATDYAGLGTPGGQGYLVGGDEARDVLNSVRAAKNINSANAGTTFAVWGHSQGGSSALFTASLASVYAPELHLVGTVASAPAAELVALLDETYKSPLAWVIGPEVLTSWPAAYPQLDVRSITTAVGQKSYPSIAKQCITSAALGGLVRTKVFNQQLFAKNPVSSPTWSSVANGETAPILRPSQPLLVAESLNDQVVLPNTTALYIQRACTARSNLTSLWLAKVGHVQLEATIAPQVVSWFGDRFAGQPTSPACSQPLPLPPASVPASG